jgi:2-polyprenyl-3-methyl-5-hydroxy-6-metoxy-1,4-benzoquinol methylase
MTQTTTPTIKLELSGHCPICDQNTVYVAAHDWYRDHLICQSCAGGSVPRERALAKVLKERHPDWRDLAIHESSPCARGVSLMLKRECPRYIGSQYFPGHALGEIVNGWRNENIECQTFQDAVFDVVVTQDVMEHVNRPDLAFRDIARTLKTGGSYIFTAPTYKDRIKSERRAIYFQDKIEHLHPPEYHGNPVDPNGALVTFHYGYDLPELIQNWSGLDVTCLRFHSNSDGIIGEFTEVYLCTKTSFMK